MENASSASEPGEPINSNSMLRYGKGMWSEWRNVGRRYGMSRDPRIFELEGIWGRRVSAGFCDKEKGQLMSLVFESLGGGKKEVLGNHEQNFDRNLIEFPPSVDPPLQLTHLTGCDELGNWSLVFNYE